MFFNPNKQKRFLCPKPQSLFQGLSRNKNVEWFAKKMRMGCCLNMTEERRGNVFITRIVSTTTTTTDGEKKCINEKTQLNAKMRKFLYKI